MFALGPVLGVLLGFAPPMADPADPQPPPQTASAAGGPAAGSPPTEDVPVDAETEPPNASESTPEAEAKPAVPSGGSVAGSTIDPDDPNRGRATSDLEGEALQRRSDLPERLPPLQRAGWWTVFGAVALGTAGGIFAGLAERQEDELDRLVFAVDLNTGSRFRYADYDDLYSTMVKRGRTQMWVSRGLLIGAGMSLAASITLFSYETTHRKCGRRSRRAKSRCHDTQGATSLRVSAASAEVSF